MQALYVYADNSQLWIGHRGDPKAKCYKVDRDGTPEVYLLDLESSIPARYRSRFAHVDEPPDCRSISVAAIAETCDKLLSWMNGDVARKLLDWEVPPDYMATTPGGDRFPVANRPISASELLKPRIRELCGGYVLTTNIMPPSKREVDALASLDDAIRLVTRLKRLVENRA